MGKNKKRKHTPRQASGADHDDSDHYVKRRRTDGDTSREARPQLDPRTGQRSAFPGLDEADGDILLYGDPTDGIEYLRMVRSEAKTVPDLLVAQAPLPTAPSVHRASSPLPGDDNGDQYEELDEEEGGYYADGAYTAHPAIPADASPMEQRFPRAQHLYHAALISRFHAYRAHLSALQDYLLAISSSVSVTTLADSHLRRTLTTVPPRAQDLVAITSQHSLNLLKRVLKLRLLTRSISKVLSTWIFGLLARLGDLYRLWSEEVSLLREVGWRAVRVLAGLVRGEEYGGKTGDGGETLLDTEEGVDEVEIEEDDGDVDEDEKGEAETEAPTAGAVPLDWEAPPDDIQDARQRILSRLAGDGAEDEDHEATLDAEEGEVLDDAKTEIAEAPIPPPPVLRRRNTSSSAESAVGGTEIPEESGFVGESAEGEESEDLATNTKATLEMIVCIIGMEYGQHDLLDAIPPWPAP